MSQIYGVLGLPDSDRSYINTIGQRIVWDAVQEVLRTWNDDVAAAKAIFIESMTSDYKRRYKLAGGGYLQRRGGSSESAATKAIGSWDVAFPLEEWGDQIAGDRVSMAYLTLDELNRHLDAVNMRYLNTVRREILVSMFANTSYSFVDPLYGSLTVQCLANGDGTLYPPVLGATSEADDTHITFTGYAASAISDTNNPFLTIRDELEEHFGTSPLRRNIAVFYNNTHAAKVEALTDFDEMNDRYVLPGVNTNQVFGLPAGLPGTVRGRVSNTWAIEWRYLPANYFIGIDLDAPKPLIERIDPPETGLQTGLQLVTDNDDYPFNASHYYCRFGLGIGNRLNGVVLRMDASAYAVPTGFSR